jgi:hypothetical protein
MAERRLQDVWVEQCAAARRIREAHGVTAALDYLVGEKLMTFAEAAATRPEFARALPRFEVRRIFIPEELEDHFARIERDERAAAEAASGPEFECDTFDAPETVAARRDRFVALRELLTAGQLGTS